MAKIRLWVSTNKVGSQCEQLVQVDDEDMPEDGDIHGDRDFNEFMMEELFNSGMVEWGFDLVDEPTP